MHYEEQAPQANSLRHERPFRFGVPQPDQLEFFGNGGYAQIYVEGLALLEKLGGTQVEIDFAPLTTVANLLYEGPWVAERYAAIIAARSGLQRANLASV